MIQFFVIVLLGITSSRAAVSYSFTLSDKDIKVFEDCIKEAGFSDTELEVAIRSVDMNAEQKVKCFNGCILKNSNAIKDDGTLDVDALVKVYHVERVKPVKTVLVECANTAKGENYCELAHAVHVCFRTSTP